MNLLLQRAARRAAPRGGRSLTSTFRHLGAAGLFILAILDSSPLPTFAGPDILTAILSASHRGLWYAYAAVATAGSVIGAYLTFRVAHKAGQAYLDRKFRKGEVSAIGTLFEKWGAALLFASVTVPFPFPTSMLFGAAGASDYRVSRFLAIVFLGRGIRYASVALIADHYGRHFVRLLRHPSQYWGWSVTLLVLIVALTVAAIVLNRRLDRPWPR
jgi:membrane protein YqaA with SNARE-associated domain